MQKVATFGEVMMRLSPPGRQRFLQASQFDITFGGAEANVAASLSRFGVPTQFVTRLPENDIAEMCLRHLRAHEVGTDHIVHGDGRMGIYFLEIGAAHRGSNVIYDRSGSALANIEPGMVDWDEVFNEADWLHWTGITPAVSQGAAEACQEAVDAAAEADVTVSCDLNYRGKLWDWTNSPSEVMAGLVEKCDLVVANEEDADKFFGISAPGADVEAGEVDADRYVTVCEELSGRFPRVDRVAITLRGSLSASHNTWTALLWDRGDLVEAPQYDIEPIVDRVGGGDSFNAGLIYKLKTGCEPQEALNFAVAASCLKHSMWGDFNLASREEVEELAAGPGSGRVSR